MRAIVIRGLLGTLSTALKNNACYSQGLGYITLIQLTMHPLATYLTDLSQNFHCESEGLPLRDLTRETITEGSVALDHRNFLNSQTTRILSRAGIITKFGRPQQTAQYYILTPLGFDTLFPA
jgi:hypothetical protein